MSEFIAGLLENIHPIFPLPSFYSDWLILAALLLSILGTLLRGYQLGRIGIAGVVFAVVGYRTVQATNFLTSGTPLWIPCLVLPGSAGAIFTYIIIGLFARAFGTDEMTKPTMMILAGVTALIGSFMLMVVGYLFVTQNITILVIIGIVVAAVSFLVQSIFVRIQRTFHNFDEVYDWMLEIPRGLTAEELWKPEEEEEEDEGL